MSLYCEEDHRWEDDEEDTTKPPLLLEHEFFVENDVDDDEVSNLLSKEKKNNNNNNNNLCEGDPHLIAARGDAVEWMMKVIGYYAFAPQTCVLAVNYLDRYLFGDGGFQFQRDKPWMIQLAAVACLSLAAKVEETCVPLLLDLQVEEAGYVFEAKTIQRMEILVLSTLAWKMNPVTPLSYLVYITRRLGFKNHNTHLCLEFLKRCECLILSLISECKFMGYLPSVIASATMLQVISDIEPCIEVEYHNQLLGILQIDKERVEECRKVIQESRSSGSHKRKYRSIPGSPKGVIDASFSSGEVSSDESSPEPMSKKIKPDHGDNNLTIPH